LSIHDAVIGRSGEIATKELMTLIQRAPGGPGAAPGRGPGRKQAFGAAPGPHSLVWFTIAEGNLSEVFYPSLDRPVLHSLRFVAAAEGTGPFDDSDATHEIKWLEPGIPCFTVETRHPEYGLTTEYIVDPEGNALIITGHFRPELPDVRLYLQAVPHDLGDGHVLDREPPALAARQGRVWMMLTGPFGRCSAGYLNSSDLRVDLLDNDGRVTAEYDAATRGHVALGAELAVAGGPFQLCLGFGGSLGAAEDAAMSALSRGATAVREGLTRAWRAQSGTDRNLLKVAGDGGALTLSSVAVLRCLEDKRRPGAFVSAPAASWADPAHRAHVVCNRDLCHIASALLDAGDAEPALRALAFLETTQREDGSWPLRYSVSGVAEEGGWDLGQIALPILLAWRLGVAGALNRDPYPRLLRQAAVCLLSLGPATVADRWLDGGEGASPSSLAAAVAALLAAAEFADDAHEPAAAEHLRVVADYWQSSVERWTFLEAEQRYVRLAADLDTGAQSGDAVSLEALELVRRGLRRHDDPRVLSTLSRADSDLRVSLPEGSGWRRFTGDTYGEAEDGTPADDDGSGQGHVWPLLAGERAHYALAAGKPVAEYLHILEACAGPELLLSEQVWDGDDLPQRGLAPGRANGGAAPFGWAHAEYVRLVAAFARSSLPDRIEPILRRYADGPSELAPLVWHHGHRIRRFPSGHPLRVQLKRRGAIVWTTDGWATSRVEQTRDTGLGFWVADLATRDVAPGGAVEWTVSYSDGRWEGGNYRLTALPTSPD
jgi:glucoamylase